MRLAGNFLIIYFLLDVQIFEVLDILRDDFIMIKSSKQFNFGQIESFQIVLWGFKGD